MSFKQKINKRTVVHGTGQLLFCPGAETEAAAIAQGLQDYELIDEIAISTKSELREKSFPSRGQLRLGKASSKMTEESYDITFGQLGYRNACLLFNADPDRDWGITPADNAQTGVSAAAGQAFDFDTGTDGVANVPGRWYPILTTTGVRVHDITACTFAGVEAAYGAAGSATAMAAGIDYILDEKLGMVKFLKSIDDDVITPTITSQTITSASGEYLKKLVPGEKAFREGIFCVYFWDDDENGNLALHHDMFYGRLTPSQGPTFNQDYVTMKGTLKVLEQGTVYVRPDVDPHGAVAV